MADGENLRKRLFLCVFEMIHSECNHMLMCFIYSAFEFSDVDVYALVSVFYLH